MSDDAGMFGRVPTLVDSNVLHDVLTDDADWLSWSGEALALAVDSGGAVINPVIYANAGHLYRCTCSGGWLSPADARRSPLPNVLSATQFGGTCREVATAP